VVPWILAAVVAAVCVAVLLPLFSAGPQKAAGPAGLVGTRAPVIVLNDDAGASVSLARYRARVVLMNLWATWCPPCREELPDLQRLYAADERRGLVVIGVDQGESASRARAFAQSLGVRFPIWIDSDQSYGRAYDALGFPTTVIIDRSGTIVRGYDGALTFDEMRAAVTPLLSRG
jgi:peroxiredoxin